MRIRKHIQDLRKRIAPLVETARDEGAELLGKAREKAEEVGADFAQSYKEAESKEPVMTGDEDDFRIPPWYILAGLGSLDRRALCDFLAVFECTSLINLSLDGARDLYKKLRKSEQAENERTFLKRIQETSEKYYAAKEPSRSDAWLRFRIWSEMRSAFGLTKALPISTASANYRCAEVADLASKYHSVELEQADDSQELGHRLGRFTAESTKKVKEWVARERSDFTQTVRKEAAQFVLKALEGDTLTEEQRWKIENEFRQKLDQLPEDMRDQSLEQAIRSGDWASVAAVGSAGTLVGLAVTVEIAGFSAYIVAAQASAIIPLLGGKTAVSLLAVLANPLFVLLATAGGGFVMNRSLKKKIGRMVASRLAVQLALQGLATQSDGLKQCLDDFKNLTDDEISDDRLKKQRETAKAISGALPSTPGNPDIELPSISETQEMDSLTAVLFPNSRNSSLNAAAVAGLTTADILFDAMAIDPQVVSATDFSRTEDINNIFEFGAFAERIESMDSLAQAGAENQLRGYLAEMMVATRLKEHDVSFAETSNTPGYDLIVDGNPFQVKCYRDADTGLRALEDHFEQYPDIPVYANSEILPAVQDSDASWADKVFGVEGFDYETTNDVLEQSLEAGADLMDLRIPLFAIAVSAARNIHGWWKGSIPLKDIPLEVAVDGAVHGTLSAAGGITGTALGLLLFGPAGAVIFGGIGQAGPLLGAGAVRRKFDDVRAKEWATSVGKAANSFRVALDEAMQSKIRRINLKASQIRASDPALEYWARLKFADQALCLAECKAELDHLPGHAVDRAKALLKLMREAGVHPWSVNEPLKNLMNVLAEQPSVTDQVMETVDKGRQWLAEKRTNISL